MDKRHSSTNVDETMDSPERRAFEINRRAGEILYMHMEIIWDESEGSDKKGTFINSLKNRIGKLIPEALDEINVAFNVLTSYDESDEKKLLNQSKDITIQLIAKYLSLEEVERRLKAKQTEEDGQQKLSRGLSFDVDETNNKINLHIPITFFEDSKSALQSLIEGLRVLAQRIQSEDELKDIDEVVGYSAFVSEKRQLLTRYGFEVTLDAQGKATDEVKISREKLIEKFGA